MTVDWKNGPFTCHEFHLLPGPGCQIAADIANAKIREWLEEASTVYLSYFGVKDNYWCENRKAIENPTHRAKLICVEEIK